MKHVLLVGAMLLGGCSGAPEPGASLPRPREGAFVRVVNLSARTVTARRNDAVFGIPLKTGSWTPFHRVAPGRHRFDFDGKALELELDPSARATLVVSNLATGVEVLVDEPRTSGDEKTALVAIATVAVPHSEIRVGETALPMPKGGTGVGRAVSVASGRALVQFGDGSPAESIDFAPGGGYTIFVAQLSDGTTYRRIVHNNPPLRLGTVNAPVGSS